MSTLDEVRLGKAKKITDLYQNREYRQEDIAKELNIPIDVVRKVTKIMNYSHGKKKTKENLNENEVRNAIHFGEELSFLDEYDL